MRQAQIPIGIAGAGVGVWQALNGDVLIGVLVAVLGCVAAGLAFAGLKWDWR